MSTYRVHEYETMRTAYLVEAESHDEALAKAAFGDFVGWSDGPHPAEEVTGYLVEVADDEEFSQSRDYDDIGVPSIPSGKSDPVFPIEAWRHDVAIYGVLQSYKEWRIDQYHKANDKQTESQAQK